MKSTDSGGDDPVTATFLERLAIIERAGAPENWDGVWRLDTK